MSERQKKLIEKEGFDTIIFLDACRFDFFQRAYRLFPGLREGDLSSVWTEGSNSGETIENTFTESYDWTVYSAHPGINSRSVPIQMEGVSGEYKASEHFSEIVDLWQFEDEEIGYVLPDTVRKEVENGSSERTKMVWFMQPHSPFVGSIKLATPGRNFDSPVPRSAPGFLDMVPMAYEYNLIRVLYEVNCLLGSLEGKVVVTSDHGELLGIDSGMYGHPCGSVRDELRTVPWLELDASGVQGLHEMSSEQYVSEVYRSVLEREPDPEGLDNYSGMLERGEISRREVLETLYESEEFSERCEVIRDVG